MNITQFIKSHKELNELKDNRYVGRRAVIFYSKNISKKFEKV